ncbi:uncharacterized protein [Solanum lycopersicum]|uniref:uncharacterized protein n=1 Tax=Solanum lycopersicum TaxID=4081 RepID=UPI0037486F75
MDPLKYIFQKAMPTGKLAKWQMLLSEFDIVYVTQKAIKAQALADHLAEKIPLTKNMNLSRHIFTLKKCHLWVKIFRKHTHVGDYSLTKRRITKCVQNLCKRFRKIEFRHTPRIQNELADALATIASIIKHPDTDYIDPLDIDLKEHPIEPDGLPWYFDIKRYLESGTYPEDATSN